MFHTKAQRHKGIKTRRKPSVPSCLCVSLRRLRKAALREFSIRVHSCYSWIASVQTCDAPPRCVAGGLRLFSIRVYSCYSWMAVCNRESRQSTRMGNSRGRFSYLPHVSHKGTETQRDKDPEKTLCAFVSLCEAWRRRKAALRLWATLCVRSVCPTSPYPSHTLPFPLRAWRGKGRAGVRIGEVKPTSAKTPRVSETLGVFTSPQNPLTNAPFGCIMLPKS